MKAKDGFDCVEMKHRIQETLTAEENGLSVAERNSEVQRRGLADPVLGAWAARLFAVVERHPAPACVAEGKVPYGKQAEKGAEKG